MTDTDRCGPECIAFRRRAYCTDRTCGGLDCSTCYGEGYAHEDCPRADCETCGDVGRVECPEWTREDHRDCDTCHGTGGGPCPDCD